VSGPRTLYAIGDVHGQLRQLQALHAQVLDHFRAEGDGRALLIHLGDLIDRGPDSRGVVEAVRTLQQSAPPGLEVVCLRGNHEEMLLQAVDHRADPRPLNNWLRNGGEQCVESYARAHGLRHDVLECLDAAHVAWIRSLPLHFFEADRNIVFVHAGIDPALWPEAEPEVLLWTRSPRFFEEKHWPKRKELEGLLVVHGHTPTPDFFPEQRQRRLNLDTGAVYGGPLTCAILAPSRGVRFLAAR